MDSFLGFSERVSSFVQTEKTDIRYIISYFVVFRICWMIHCWISVCGKTASIACGNPVSPSTQAIRMSSTPRFFNPFKTKLIPYETIVRATSSEPETVDEALRHYRKRIRIGAIENGHIDRDTEDSIKSRLVAALFKFRFDKHEV